MFCLSTLAKLYCDTTSYGLQLMYACFSLADKFLETMNHVLSNCFHKGGEVSQVDSDTESFEVIKQANLDGDFEVSSCCSTQCDIKRKLSYFKYSSSGK